MSIGQLGSNQTSLERDCLRAVNEGCSPSVLDRPLILWLNLPVVDKIHPKSNKCNNLMTAVPP